MMWRTTATALCFAGLFAGGAAAQSTLSTQPDPLSRLDIESRRQINALIDSARLADLPWNAIRLKAVEGVNRRFDGRRVLTVVRSYYGMLAASKNALGARASEEEIEAGAASLAAHLTADDLANFRVVSADRSPMRALVYLADLVDKHSVPRDEAVTAFAKLWKDGAADADFDALWRSVDLDILSGVSPKAALQNGMRSLPPRLSKPPE